VTPGQCRDVGESRCREPWKNRDVTSDDVRIHRLTASHWSDVREIYADGIAGGHATFELAPPEWPAFAADRPEASRLVAVDVDEAVLGWVAATPVSDRCVYAGVVEHSVYVAQAARGRGVARLLLGALARATEEAGVWTIQSGIFAENEVSLRVHEAAGFRRVGIRQRLGLMRYGPLAGHWRDVVLVERRSTVVGT